VVFFWFFVWCRVSVLYVVFCVCRWCGWVCGGVSGFFGLLALVVWIVPCRGCVFVSLVVVGVF
jgi:hypothetical protein